MVHHLSSSTSLRTGWFRVLSRTAAAILLFALLSGLAVTLGPFHRSVEWGVLLHPIIGVLAIAPLAWYCMQHWQEYRGQALSDVLLLGYFGVVGLLICLVSGLVVTGQALVSAKTSPWLRYVHLISTLLTLAAMISHILIAWWRRRGPEASQGAWGWLGAATIATVGGVGLTIALTFAYSGT